MNSSRFSKFLSRRKVTIAIAASVLLFVGVAANGAGNLITPNSGGYLVCAKPENRIITHFANSKTAKCPKGFQKVSIGAQGIKGVPGLIGATGLSGSNGKDGKDGKTLWNGVKDPEITWGAPGDMYINATAKTLFGPKNLDGTWPAGVSIVGPKGDQGPIGLTGAAGPQGPGGSGPAGATGATGATGPAGATGADGVGSQNPVYFGTKGDTALLTTSSVAISLSLPAGSYLLTYSGIAFGINGQADEYVMCKIAAPATFAGTSVYVNGLSELNNRKYMVLQETITLTATETVQVNCRTQYAGNRAIVSNQSFSAVKVSSIVNQS
jgi:hypothetical protein